ncbi:MAG: transposase zinc-binding domain-containing protein [Planctomycetes bacterium]|nr:transposase zinc-binding domain-containing protein [Planctomycetota bacterium]
MMRTPLEVADVFRDGEAGFLSKYGQTLSREQRQVLRAVIRCRTAELGGHVQQCDDCGHQRIQYNSCRNRHCPKCQAMARAAWLEKRESELLPVGYFHVVFTLPHELGPLALQNKRVVYGILFRAAAQTLLEIAADPQHLGAKIGCLMVVTVHGSVFECFGLCEPGTGLDSNWQIGNDTWHVVTSLHQPTGRSA